MKIKYLKILVLLVVVFSFVGCSTDETEFENKGIEKSLESQSKVLTPISVNYITITYRNDITQIEKDAVRNRYFTNNYSGGSIDGKSFPQFYTVRLYEFNIDFLHDVWAVEKWTLGKPGSAIGSALESDDDVDDYSGW